MGKIETFEDAVKNRAAQRVEDKVTQFKQAIRDAARILCPNNWSLSPGYDVPNPLPDEVREILTVMASGDHCKNWPTWIWENEEAVVRAELFRVMDEMQKALLAKPPSGDDVNIPQVEPVGSSAGENP